MLNSSHKTALDVYVNPIHDRFLIFSPLRGLSAVVNKEIISGFIKFLEPDNTDNDHPSFFKEFTGPVTNVPGKRKGAPDPVFLGIIPSRRCNLSCLYCNFGAKKSPKEKLETATAVAAIDYIAELTEKRGKREYFVEFFGGEPFVEQDILDVVIHHALLIASRTGVIPHFSALSNGVLDENQARFAGDYFDRIVISIDGFSEMHNRTRPVNNKQGSFDKVVKTLKYLRETQAELCLRCCITSENVHQMQDIATWFCEEFHTTTLNFETLSENEETRKAGLKSPDPYVYAKQFVLSQRIVNHFGAKLVNATVLAEEPQNSFCPVGKDALIVMPDGRISSCYLVPDEWEAKGLDLIVGNISENGHVFVDMDRINSLRKHVAEKERCENCFCRYSCAGGCHVTNTYPGSETKYSDFCIHTRIIQACKLLSDMGMDTMVFELIHSDKALHALADQSSDHIIDVGKKHA